MPDILSYLRSFRHLIHLPDGDGELLQRFRVKRDELAFATLVQRHGPMVLGIAQRILGQSNLLDDVFQATFLVLAKRGRQMETWPSVAGWLVQVARRTALQARAKSARRARHEQQAAAMTSISVDAEPAEVVSQRELAQQLDAELARLPSKYRTPLVLCHLEGQTKEETARQLGWPVGSVSGRLARGKQLLQARLLRRGIVPTLATGILTIPAANAHLPSLLIQATTLLATNVVHQTSQVPTGTAVVLAQGVMTSMFMTQVKYAASILLVLGLCLGTGAWAWQGQRDQATAQVPKNDVKAATPKSDSNPASLLSELQGTWMVVKSNETTLEAMNVGINKGTHSYLSNLNDLKNWKFRDKQVYIADNWSQLSELPSIFMPFEIDTSTTPAKIQMAFNSLSGTIELKDGKLQVCLVQSGAIPGNVASIKDDPHAVMQKMVNQIQSMENKTNSWTVTLRRATDYDHLEGIWRKEERNPVTNEIESAEELIFKKNMYVRRFFSKGTYYDLAPEVFLLNETTTPKQIDLDIRSAAQVKDRYATWLNDDNNLPTFIRDNINKNRVVERRLGIYELKDNEFRYLITGSIPFTLVNKGLVLNPGSSTNNRATSFDTTKGTVHTYKRVERSMKDSGNIKLGAPEDPASKPPTGASETLVTEPPATPPQLLELRQQRLKLAQERMKLWKEAEVKGNPKWTKYEDLSRISQQLLDASLAMAADHTSKLQAMEEHLKVLKEIEEHNEQAYKSGIINKDSLLASQLRRIEFEIQLQELKEKR